MKSKLSDYIIQNAIKLSYKSHVENKPVDNLLTGMFQNLSDKFGYKIVSSTSDVTHLPNHLQKLGHLPHNNSGKMVRFLDYSTTTKNCYYFDNTGNVYTYVKGDYKTLIEVPIETFELYNQHEELLSYVKKHGDNISKFRKNAIDYVMIGYDNKHKFYLGSDNKLYYSNGASLTKQVLDKSVTKNLYWYGLDILKNLKYA